MKAVWLSLLLYGVFTVVQAGFLIASLEPGKSLGAFTLGLIVWGAVPYMLDAALVLLMRKRPVVRFVAAFTCLLGLLDLGARYLVLFRPQSSTDPIAVIFLPFLHIALVMVLLIIGLLGLWLSGIAFRARGKHVSE